MPTATAADTETKPGTKPLRIIRLRGVSASIFANEVKSEGRTITFHKVSLQRSYKDGDEWKHTGSLGRDDLPLAILVMQRAWEFIVDTEAARRGKDDAAE